MQWFAQLVFELDSATSDADRDRSLSHYFERAPAADAAWAVHLLLGRMPRRLATLQVLRGWFSDYTNLPPWLVELSQRAVGDWAETLALLATSHDPVEPLPLHELIEACLNSAHTLAHQQRRELAHTLWQRHDARQRLLINKLLTGTLRLRVESGAVARVLAHRTGVPAAVVLQRIMREWRPTAEAIERCAAAEPTTIETNAMPFVFCMIKRLELSPDAVGPLDDWQVEWKWDGVRAQIVGCDRQTMIWTDDGDLVSSAPSGIAAARVPEGCTLDGELIRLRNGLPQPGGTLFHSNGRRRQTATTGKHASTVFVAYDLLRCDGVNLTGLPLHVRRAQLEQLAMHCRFGAIDPSHQTETLATSESAVRLSPVLHAHDWAAVAAHRESAARWGVNGLLLKQRHSAYGHSHTSPWWVWPIELRQARAVLTSVTRGRRRGAPGDAEGALAIPHGDGLVRVGRAALGLAPDEMERLNGWVRANTTGSFGPTRLVPPSQVFEITFDQVTVSPDARRTVLLRSLRIARWRPDLLPSEATRFDELAGMAITHACQPAISAQPTLFEM